MSVGEKYSMRRKVIHRSYRCLVIEYDDGERAVMRDVERIRWVLTECELLVSIIKLY
jgi:hypothetical protein